MFSYIGTGIAKRDSGLAPRWLVKFDNGEEMPLSGGYQDNIESVHNSDVLIPDRVGDRINVSLYKTGAVFLGYAEQSLMLWTQHNGYHGSIAVAAYSEGEARKHMEYQAGQPVYDPNKPVIPLKLVVGAAFVVHGE